MFNSFENETKLEPKVYLPLTLLFESHTDLTHEIVKPMKLSNS